LKTGVSTAPLDLIVEIVSPSSRGIDRVRKSALYATHGVSEYWIVDPDGESILAQELQDGAYREIRTDDGLIRSRVLEGLVIDPTEIFAMPDWMVEVTE
jgi:Uma2 family endonuclease